MKYYTCTKALSYGTPFIFTLGTRSIGKTFSYTSLCINSFKKKRKKFIYMRRYDDDLKLVVPTLFDNVRKKYKDTTFDIKGNGKSGTEFYIDEQLAGITVALSKAYKYKSVNLSEYDIIFFDEFIPENGIYLADEVDMALNFYQTVARGYNMPIRPDCKFIFVANHVTLNNTYFRELKIRDKINLQTKYAIDQDKAWLVELTDSEEITNEILNTPFGKMIARMKYGDYALRSKFYLDDDTFIQKPTGKSEYYGTLLYNGEKYGVYFYTESGLLFISRRYNEHSGYDFALTTKDHAPNYVLLHRIASEPLVRLMKYAFDNGMVRFDSGPSKFMFLEFMSYLIEK